MAGDQVPITAEEQAVTTKKIAPEAAAAAEAVKPADVVAPTVDSDDGEKAGDSSDEEDIRTVKVHHQDTVDYILSWTYAERNPFKNLYQHEDDDEDGFVTSEEREIFAYFAEQTEGLIRFQQQFREEYEATGYVRVPDDYEEKYARLQAAIREDSFTGEDESAPDA